MARLRVATYNTAFYKRAERSDFEKLFAQADIVGFQEMGHDEDHRMMNSFPEWETYKGRTKGTPIAWKKDEFTLLASGSYHLSDATSIDAGSGPSHQNPEYLTWVRLKHKDSGRIINFGSTHLTPSIHYAARYRLHDRQSDNLKRWVQSVSNHVIFVGDFNIDARKDAKERDPNMPFVKFGSVGVHSNFRSLGIPPVATHGKRYIYYVFYKLRDSIKPIAQKVLSGYSSDHRPLVVEFEVKPTLRKRLFS
jgi:endonuclease/exonuclease/phosphatase family metal-dependent hydrolase